MRDYTYREPHPHHDAADTLPEGNEAKYMYTTVRSEKGMALVMALSAIVIIGVLIGAIVFVSTQDSRIGSNTMRASRAAAAAEMGMNRVRQDWVLADNNRLRVGDTLKKAYTAPRGATATVIVTKVSGVFFWVVSEGVAGALGSQATARRRYGSLFRLDSPDIPFMGALTGRGHVTVSGNAIVSGKDSQPTGWSGCPPRDDISGIAAPDTSTANIPACLAGKTCVDGKPKFIQTPLAADTTTYFVYGNGTYQSLAATANVIISAGATLTGLGPVVVSGQCATSVVSNWGDMLRAVLPTPPGACESYYPIIHALGDVHISGGKGQGILLVDGDLFVTGGFEFTGAVIVRGSMHTAGTGAHFSGAVMAANVDFEDDLISGNSSIRYSSCALQAAMNGNAYPKLAKQRAWVDVE
jgi:hypothetical protein